MYTVEFPGLWGLKFSLDPIALHMGKLNIYWYGIIIATGFMIAVYLAMKNSKTFGIESESMIDLVLFAAPVAIIFARLYYVAFSWENYRDNPGEIFKIWHGGIAIYGAILGSLLVAYLFAKYKKIPIFNLLDLGVPYLVLAQAIGRWGNFVNQEAYGVNTKLPWGMTSDKIKSELSFSQIPGIDPNVPVHPTFLYESLWNLGVFLFLIWYRNRRKIPGDLFCLYMILYGAGRFWIEGLRTDSLMLGNLRVSQVLALAFVLALTIVFFKRRANFSSAEYTENKLLGTSEYGTVLRKLQEEEGANTTIENQMSGTCQAESDADEGVQEECTDKHKKE